MVKYKAWNQNNLKSSLWHEKLKKKKQAEHLLRLETTEYYMARKRLNYVTFSLCHIFHIISFITRNNKCIVNTFLSKQCSYCQRSLLM